MFKGRNGHVMSATDELSGQRLNVSLHTADDGRVEVRQGQDAHTDLWSDCPGSRPSVLSFRVTPPKDAHRSSTMACVGPGGLRPIQVQTMPQLDAQQRPQQ